MNKNGVIRDLIDDALDLLDRIRIDYDSCISVKTSSLLRIVEKLSPLVRGDYSTIYDILQHSLNHITFSGGYINAYSFGDLRTAIEVLDMLYPHHEKKIFISYSSKDEDIVRKFRTDILLAACSLSAKEIFCTIDHSVIKTGEDFRNEIVRNMKECDIILLMISNNYKQSEVCLNEMGAAWALNGKKVMPFVLPEFPFEDMGFLYGIKQGASITDKTKLDELYKDICEAYDIEQDWIHFNQISNDFIKSIPNVSN